MNYPTGVKYSTKTIDYGNRGMKFEEDLNITNEYYLLHNIAVIYKKPTPITIVDVDYPSRKEAVIKKAYFKVQSTTDYNGIYKGKYIDFEAKETKNKKGFPLINIHQHQIEHLKRIDEHGGIGFILVKFTSISKIYFLDIKKINQFIKEYNKSIIPIQYFDSFGYAIKEKYSPRVDYLELIDKIYFNKEDM